MVPCWGNISKIVTHYNKVKITKKVYETNLMGVDFFGNVLMIMIKSWCLMFCNSSFLNLEKSDAKLMVKIKNTVKEHKELKTLPQFNSFHINDGSPLTLNDRKWRVASNPQWLVASNPQWLVASNPQWREMTGRL